MKFLSLAFLFVVGCSASGPHRVVSGSGNLSFGAPTKSYQDVKPVFAKYCSECHPARSQPDWLNYAQAKPFAENGVLIRRVWTEKSMPPEGSAEAASITDSDRQKIADWARTDSTKAPVVTGGPSSSEPADSGPVAKCLQCHGPSTPSAGGQPKIPILAGQNEAYLNWQLNRFKWRERIDPGVTMNDIAAELSAKDIAIVAQYFSARTGLNFHAPPAPEPTDKFSYERGQKYAAQYCISCHMNSQTGLRPDNLLIPALTGQSKQYLLYQLLYFRDLERHSPLMYEFAKDLTNEQVEDLANYFSSR